MKKNLILIVLFLFVWILLFVWLNIFKTKPPTITSNNTQQELWLHNGKPISDILNKNNYEKVWINPEKYATLEAFLQDFKTFTWVEIDPINENFTIWVEKENGNTLYIPFKFKENADVFQEKQAKNLAILDIYTSYQSGMIYGGINSQYGNKVIFENENYHPESQELKKFFNREVNVFEYINSLEKTQVLWKDKEELLAYLYDFTWDYQKAQDTRQDTCKEFQICQDKYTKITVSGQILDSDEKPIAWAKIELLNDTSISTISDAEWKYTLAFSFSSLAHLRFKTSILWYSDGFANYSLNQNMNLSKQIALDFHLHKYHDKVAINPQTVSEYEKGKYYLITTENSKYFIPKDGLYYLDGRKYEKNDFEVYLYQFTKWSNMENLLENDTFEPVFWYVWNIMKTFWMPYIQFIDRETKQELFIKSSNPMILQNQIYHMQELYDNYDKIYSAVTPEDMNNLYKYSQEHEWYPIDFDYLVQNNFLRWPARWALDRKTWIWQNVWQRLLDTNGLVELPFYSIKDN